jgi:alpha-beta hydrolase superfamily lysophospholipase
MIPLRLLWIAGAVWLALAALWLAGDAAYARHILARSAQSEARRTPGAPFMLNAGGAPAMLLIHGFADGPSVFAQLAPNLAGAGLAVQGMHLSGSGLPPTRMAGTTLDTWRADIDRAIAALRADDPARSVWLLGHSLGGTLAFDAALRPDNRVAGLVLLAPLIEPSSARSPLLTSRQWFRIFDRMLVFTRIVESRLPPDLHDPAARTAYQTDKFIHRDIYRALFDAIDAVRPRAAEWRGPLWMAIAPADQIVDCAASRRFFSEALHAAPAELVEQTRAGHVLPLDHGHADLAARIAGFIRETATP